MFWTLLWKNKSLIAFGIITLIVGLYIGALKLQINSLKNALSEQEKVNAELRIDIAMEQAKVQRLQDAISVLKAEGDKKTANAAMWRKKFESSERHWQEAFGGLITWTPKPDESECAAAKRLLKEYRSK